MPADRPPEPDPSRWQRQLPRPARADIARRQVAMEDVALGFAQPSVDIRRDQVEIRTRAQLFYFRVRHVAPCWPDPQRSQP